MSELVSGAPNSLLAGKIQGILLVQASECDKRLRIRQQYHRVKRKFPTHRNREIISALQGIKSVHQGSFRPDQGFRIGFHLDPYFPTAAASSLTS